MTAEDRAALLAIVDAPLDVRALTAAIRAYWRDPARADRTPRSILFLHMGMLHGLIERLLLGAGPGGDDIRRRPRREDLN